MQPFQLRDYQAEVLECTYASFKQGYKYPLINQHTGTGKSVLAQNIGYRCLDKGNKVLFLVPRDFLVDNLREYFNRSQYGVVQTGVEFDYSKAITIALAPSFHAQLKKGKIPPSFKPQLVVWDECHKLGCESWSAVYEWLNENSNPTHIGLTATPERFDGKPLDKYFDTIIPTHNLRWFIDRGYLSDYEIYGDELSIDFSQLKKSGWEYNLKEQSRTYENPTIIGKVVDFWADKALGQKFIYFCPSVETSKQVADDFNRFGQAFYGKDIAAHIDGNSHKAERRSLLAQFNGTSEENELLILTNVNLFLEGLNVPSCAGTGWLRKTASPSVLIQGNGRSLRYEPGKVAKIFDHVQNFAIHPRPDFPKIYSLAGKSKDRLAKQFICVGCERVLAEFIRELVAEGVSYFRCECGTLNSLPGLAKRASGGVERKEYEFDTNRSLRKLQGSGIRVEIDKIVVRAYEMQATGKKGKGWAVHQLKELVTKIPLLSDTELFNLLKYGLTEGLGYPTGFVLTIYKELQNQKQTTTKD